MNLLVVVEDNLCVERRVDAIREKKLDRLVEIVNSGHGRAVGLGLSGVGAGDRVRGLLAFEVGHRLYVVVIAADDDRGAVVGVGCREIVGLLAFWSDSDSVDHDIIASGVKSGEKAVPFALDEGRFDSELVGDRLSDLDVVSDEFVVLVVVGPRSPCAFHSDDDLALFLYRLKLVFRGFRSASGSCDGGSGEREREQRGG